MTIVNMISIMQFYGLGATFLVLKSCKRIFPWNLQGYCSLNILNSYCYIYV